MRSVKFLLGLEYGPWAAVPVCPVIFLCVWLCLWRGYSTLAVSVSKRAAKVMKTLRMSSSLQLQTFPGLGTSHLRTVHTYAQIAMKPIVLKMLVKYNGL